MESETRIKYCGVAQCKTCKNKQLDTDDSFYSNLNKKSFSILFSQNCKTNIVIYQISCKSVNCTLKYIGRTNHSISRRLALHRANILAGTEGPAMHHHFTKIHQPSDMQIKAIEVCAKATIKEREKYWLNELNTAFPYGLNDRIGAPSIQDAYKFTIKNSSVNKTIYETFTKEPSKRTKRGGKKKNNNQSITIVPHMFMNSLKITQHDIPNQFYINHIRTEIMKLGKENTKKLYLHLCQTINNQDNNFTYYNNYPKHSYMAYLCKDLCLAKLKAIYSKNVIKSPKNFIVVEFSSKIVENIQLTKLLRKTNLVRLFPKTDDGDMAFPTVSYKYSKTIRSKICNYRNAIKSGATLANCDCHLYDKDFKVNGHIFTGNLSIIENKPLQSLMKKGLNYRDNPFIKKDVIYNSISNSINEYIDKVSKENKINHQDFAPWKNELLLKIKRKLDELKFHYSQTVLNNQANANHLESLKAKWVFIPTDKASNNISIVCKKYYVETLETEIYNSGNYEKINNNDKEIIQQHKSFLTKFNLQTDEKIPFLYWTAKLHKNPPSQRFITSGRNCTIQPLSIQIGHGLKTILNIIRSNARFQFKKSKINNYSIIYNRRPVTNFIQFLNKLKGGKSISTFDFKTLYTSIPHTKLKEAIASLIRKAFTSRKKKFIYVNNKTANLLNERRSGFCLSVQQMIDCVNFLVDNNYILYKDDMFRQVKGIPMGTNCAPHLANLFLHYYESNYIEELSRIDPDTAKLLNNRFRYQDDCIVFNDEGTFEYIWHEMYPAEMVLEKTNDTDSCTFLDLEISLINGQIVYRSYDKRNSYEFEVIKYPDLSSNVPKTPSYAVFSSQMIRFCEVNSSFEQFKLDTIHLYNKLVAQNFDKQILKAKFRKFYGNNIV